MLDHGLSGRPCPFSPSNVMRTRTLVPAVTCAVLLALLSPVAGRGQNAAAGDSAGSHDVWILDAHDEALAHRLELIDAATHSVDFSTFIVEEDPVALDVLHHLGDAAQRGVRVRLLLDGQFNRLSRGTMAFLVGQGVEIRQYQPFRWYKALWFFNRLHDKLLLVDTGCPPVGSADPSSERSTGPQVGQMILGGRNLSQPYFGIAGRLPRAYVDRDLRVDGPVTADACRYFERLWGSSQTRFPRLGWKHPEHTLADCERRSAFERGRCRRGLRQRAQALREARALFREAHETSAHPSLSTASEARRVTGPVAFLNDPVGAKELDIPIVHRLLPDPPRIGPELLRWFATTEREIVIESPYLVPSRGFRRALSRLRDRDVDVRILTNSLLTTDNLVPQAAYRNAQEALLESGVDLWEYAGAESMHAKSAVIDDRISIVGSYNLDPRSEHLNTEIAVVIEDAAFARALRKSLDARLEQSWQLGPNGIVGSTDGVRYPGVSRGKICKMTLLRLVTPLLRRQI